MHVLFTDEERRYIKGTLFSWNIAEDAPKAIKATLRRKFELLEKQRRAVKDRGRSKEDG